jgi:hypothetical protein
MDYSLGYNSKEIDQMLLKIIKMGKLNLIENIPFLVAFLGLLGKYLANPSPPKPKNKRRKDLHQFQEMANNEGHAFNPSTKPTNLL